MIIQDKSVVNENFHGASPPLQSFHYSTNDSKKPKIFLNTDRSKYLDCALVGPFLHD